MNSKIEISFQNSQFYKNYNNIDQVILHFKTIKNEYSSSKNKYKNKLISIANTLYKNKIRSTFLEFFIKKIFDKFGSIIFKNEFNNLFRNKIHNYEKYLYTCRKILSKQIDISFSIKKYVKTAFYLLIFPW